MTDNTDEQETLIEFPCDFMIKVMGKTGATLENFVLNTAFKHDSNFDAAKTKKRASKNGNYTSLTITVYVESKPQLDAIYQELSENELVLWAM